MTAMMTDMMTDMTVINQDIVMVIEKEEIKIMKTMVLIETDIDPPVDMVLGNQKKINYGNMYREVQLYSIVTKYQSKTSQNHKNTHKCVNYSLYNAQWYNIPSCKGHTILSLQVHIYAKSRKLYFTAYLCNEPSSR